MAGGPAPDPTGRHTKHPAPDANHLASLLADLAGPGLVIVCVGNELRGDDAAGTALAEELARRHLPWPVHDTRTAPESFVMKIVQQVPESVIVIDTLDFGAAPGNVALFEPDEMGGLGPSTHGPAPVAFLKVLGMMHACRRAVLGIQPLSTEFGRELSSPVRRAVDMIAEALATLAASMGPRPTS